MPPKGKAAVKSKGSDTQPPAAAQSTTLTSQQSKPKPTTTEPITVFERSKLRYEESLSPAELALQQQPNSSNLSKLSPPEQIHWFYSLLSRSPSARTRAGLGPKALKEVWKHINDNSIPIRPLNRGKKPSISDWGTDRAGQDIGAYPLARFEERRGKQILLTSLEIESRRFKENRDSAQRGLLDTVTREKVIVTEQEFEEEKGRRRQIARLRAELYGTSSSTGQGTPQGGGFKMAPTGTANFALNPEWDDITPVPHEEGEHALAAIAYPGEYAEAISYLRAVMLTKEYSQRCLDLTAYIIEMNPAHYTVWLYRASIIFAMKLSIPAEIEWLNQVALENLKNYQIWHHRHLLVDEFFPSISSSPEEIAKFATSEREFLTKMLQEDSKNYHVWSYRSYLVSKLGGKHGFSDTEELASIEKMIENDVRNNSAWSHRFFLVFSNPEYATIPADSATEADPKIPGEIIDREVQYAMDKIYLAPQNQSPWNYLRGVMVKGGRKLASVEEFVGEFVRNLGENGGEEGKKEEDILSTHALDLLSEIWAEKGEKEKADLGLRRLAEKWDRIRVGYWEWRRGLLKEGEGVIA